MRKRAASVVIVVGCAFTGNADAADILRGSIAPPPAPSIEQNQIQDWTGFYIGAHAGYAWGQDRTSEFLTANGMFTGLTWKYDANSALAGVHVGALYQFDSTVLGIEGDITATAVRGGFVDPGGSGVLTNNWQGSVRAKAGYSFGRVMPFVTAGVAFGNLKYAYTNPVGPITETTQAVRAGFTAGAGVAYALTESIRISGEYRYTDFGKFNYASLAAFPILTGRQQPQFHSLLSSISYKF